MLRYVSRGQRLSDVSLSHLWIEFCPGSEWCDSIPELLRYMRARTFPSPEIPGGGSNVRNHTALGVEQSLDAIVASAARGAVGAVASPAGPDDVVGSRSLGAVGYATWLTLCHE